MQRLSTQWRHTSRGIDFAGVGFDRGDGRTYYAHNIQGVLNVLDNRSFPSSQQ